jgi:hypothetical protein
MSAKIPSRETLIRRTVIFAGRHVTGIRLATLAGLTLLALAMPATADALTTLSQGYVTKDKLTQGAIVSLENDTSDQVNAASSGNVESILGVVINDDNSLLTLSTGETSQVQVATSGIIRVLVSDINGDITQGDQITASPISGVGMKATDSIKVIGIAQGKLVKEDANKHTYKDKDGQEHTVTLGEVPTLVNVSYYFKQPEKTVIPSALQNVANALAGKAVKPLPIIVSLAIFVVALITVVSIVYSMIRSSIISVGRNPMAQGAVYRNVIQLSALILIILGVTVISIYMILTRL